MTTENGTSLAVREMSLAEIGRRIKLYQQPGWGLERATQPQLNLLALYCQKLRLLPGEEVTLYDGKPWITIDGRVTLMRRHEEYITYRQRPLTREEKEAWGYDPGDIVVATTVVFMRNGLREELEAYGRVSLKELDGTPEINPETGRPAERLNPLARRGRKPVEVAQKRSLARGERFTFGTAHDDEDPDEVQRVVIEERNDPARVARNAEIYDRTIGAADWGETEPTREPTSPAVEDDTPADAPPTAGALVTSKTHPLWKRWLSDEQQARLANLDIDTSTVKLGQITDVSLEASCAQLEGMLAEQQPVEQEAF